jgi:hypothetical protein
MPRSIHCIAGQRNYSQPDQSEGTRFPRVRPGAVAALGRYRPQKHPAGYRTLPDKDSGVREAGRSQVSIGKPVHSNPYVCRSSPDRDLGLGCAALAGFGEPGRIWSLRHLMTVMRCKGRKHPTCRNTHGTGSLKPRIPNQKWNPKPRHRR